MAAVGDMLRSDVLEMRLYAADAFDRTKPGPWVEALRPVLQDPNGLNRIHAAEILREAAPEEAAAALRAGAEDLNPVVRADATRVLEGGAKAASANLPIPTLRKLSAIPIPACVCTRRARFSSSSAPAELGKSFDSAANARLLYCGFPKNR